MAIRHGSAGAGESRVGQARKRPFLAVLALVLLLLAPLVQAWPSRLPGGIIPERVAGLGDFASDFLWLDAERLIIVGKRGRVALYRNGGFAGNLLDIGYKVAPAAGDRGVMGIAMDPGFYTGRPYIYLAYTVDPNRNGAMNYNMLSRFTYRGDRLADERLLLGGGCRLDGSFNYNGNCSPMPGTTHSIGSLWFPGDGALWVSIGEGNIHDGTFWTTTYGYVGTDRALAMDPDFLGGKILRINPDSGMGLGDNPFCGGDLSSARCKVWAVGLRNPFKCAGGPGQVRCGDVGWYTIESYKLIGRGQNTGWPCYEGANQPPDFNPSSNICQRIYSGANPYPGINTGVLFQWNHNGGSSAVIGGIQIPGYYPGVGGRWIVADYVSGQVWALAGGSPTTFFVGADNPVAFRMGMDGWLYYLSNQGGTIIRLRIAGMTPPGVPTGPRQTTRKATTTRRPVRTTSRPPPDPMCEPRRPIRVPTCAVSAGQQPMDPIMWVSREGWPTNRVRFLRNGAWGAVGLDASVGNRTRNSGRSLVVGKQWFITGYGTHAHSQIQLQLNRCCFRMTSFVGVDDETQKFYGDNARNGEGEFILRNMDTAARPVLYNSSRSVRRRLVGGASPAFVDRRNLQSVSRMLMEAVVPKQRFGGRTPSNVWRPAHLDWAETKLYCGPRAPYAPIIKILSPAPGAAVLPNSNVSFSATATFWDRKTPIPASAFNWDINLIHCQGSLCHQHNPYQYKGVTSGEFLAFPHDDTTAQYYYWSVQLRVTDRCGNYDIIRRSVTMIGFQEMV